jgi:hypothetical protein
MKIKNFLMALVAFTFAIGASFASMLTDEDVYIYGQPDEFSAAQCIRTTGQCDNAGTNVCRVRILQDIDNTLGTSTTTSSTFKTYRGTTCASLLSDTGGELQDVIAPDTDDDHIYRLVQKP